MTLHITLPESLYQWIADLATRQQVSVERMAAAALTEQLAAWARVEGMARQGSRDRFLAALDSVPDIEPAPEDRFVTSGS